MEIVRSKKVCLFVIGVFLLLWTNASFAAGDAGLIQTITNRLESVTQSWHANLRPVVLGLFITLITISLTYSAISMTLKGVDLPVLMSELVTLILLFGFWMYVIQNSITIVNAIINSFNKAANIASGNNYIVTPAHIINNGISLAEAVIDQAGFFDTPIYGFLALILLLAYFFIAGTLFVVLVESYIVTGAGIILLGFSGSPWTSDIAKKYLFFTFGVGIKLFTTIIVVRFGEALVRHQLTVESELKQIFAIVGVICLIAYLTNRIPSMAQAMIAGSSSSSPNDVRGIASIASRAAASAAMGAVGTAAAGYQAHKYATENTNSMNPTIAAATKAGDAPQLNVASASPSKSIENNPNAIPSVINTGSRLNPKPQSEISAKKQSHEDNQDVDESSNSKSVEDNKSSAIQLSKTNESKASDRSSGTSFNSNGVEGHKSSAIQPSGTNESQGSNRSSGTSFNPNSVEGHKSSAIQPSGTNESTGNSSRIEKGLSYLRSFSSAYMRGSKDAIVERLSEPKMKNSALDTAKKISENRISDKIKRES